MTFINVEVNKITTAQDLHIEQLAIDLNLDRKQKIAHISDLVGRQIRYLDDLTLSEASAVIDKFLDWKDGKRAINKEIRK